MGQNKKILVIDDDPVVRSIVSGILRKNDFDILLAKEGSEGLKRFQQEKPDIVITDYQMPGMTGLEVLNNVHKLNASVPVVILTAHGDATLTIESIKKGAFDFIEKPIKPKELLTVVKNALNTSTLSLSDTVDPGKNNRGLANNLMVGKSPVMREIFKNIGRISKSKVDVLITGDTGTGKERIARLIYESDNSKPGRLIFINCNKTNEQQLVAAFDPLPLDPDGSDTTILLDDVGKLPMQYQILLIDLIHKGVDDNEKSRPRLISLTSDDIYQMTAENKFLKELYYRMKVFSLHIPPLRERKDDIPDLVEHLMQEINAELGKNISNVEDGSFEFLKMYEWPGNIQELRNVIMQAMVLSHGQTLEKKYLQIDGIAPHKETDNEVGTPPKSLDEIEKEHIATVLKYTRGNKQQASIILGITRPTLNTKIEKYGLKRS